jgi:hypothetical protein
MVRHPHDVRIGDQQLKSIVEKENRKFKQAAAKKKELRKHVENELEGKTIARLFALLRMLFFVSKLKSLSFFFFCLDSRYFVWGRGICSSCHCLKTVVVH